MAFVLKAELNNIFVSHKESVKPLISGSAKLISDRSDSSIAQYKYELGQPSTN